MHILCTCSPNRGRYARASELKLLVVTASTTLNRATPSHRFRTHNLVVVGSSPTRLTLGLSRLPTDVVSGLGDDYLAIYDGGIDEIIEVEDVRLVKKSNG